MPRRYQPPTRRRKKKQSRPNVPVASTPPFVPEEVVEQGISKAAPDKPAASARGGSALGGSVAAAPATVHHIGRDYSYVVLELRRSALLIALIVGGLIVAAALLRWL